MKSLIFACLVCVTVAIAHPGIGIVVDSKGNIFYTDLIHVWKISVDGELSIAVKNVHTHELYIDKDDDLYGEHEWYKGEAIDKWGNYVWRLSKNGELKRIIPEVEGFIDNTRLTRDKAGNSYWVNRSANKQILMKSNSSGQSAVFSQHPFKNIRWKYYSKSDQHLYLVDHLTIKKVNLHGEVSLVTDQLKEEGRAFNGLPDHHYIFGIWSDLKAGIYAAVFGAGKVKHIAADGTITTAFESESGWSPCGGITLVDGTMWIMEFSKRNQTRVIRISKSGQQTIFGD